jgi:ankyrin repeat protein
MKPAPVCCCFMAIFGALLTLSLPVFGQDTTDMLNKALDLVHQGETPGGTSLTDVQRIDLLTQAIQVAQQAPNHRLRGHRVLAIQAIRTAIAEIRRGDPDKKAAGYLQTADAELTTSISLAGTAEPPDATTNGPTPTLPAVASPASVSSGADINARNNLGDTPLLDAAKEGEKDTAELLLAKGAAVDAKDNSGCTPLTWAAIQGHRDVAELLLAHGANVNARSSSGQTALQSAAMNGHKDVAELLLTHGAEINAPDNCGITPLHWAAGNGHKDLVELLLAHGAEVNAKTKNGYTPLQSAELYHHDDVAELLHQHGGQESDRQVVKDAIPGTFAPPVGAAPLLAAARAGDTEKVKALLQSDPTLALGDVDKFSTTPLIVAAANNHKDVVELLLANHADVNAKDILGMTALIYAAGSDYKDTAELLLANKADSNLGDHSNLTPLFQAALMGHKDMAELLLANGADVNSKGKEGSVWSGVTPLYIAACNGAAGVAQVLLAHGADPNAKGHDGLTPLQIAVKNHHDTPDVPQNDVADLLRPQSQEPTTPPVAAVPSPGVTLEMEQAFLTKYKAALEKQDPDALFSMVATDPNMDSKAKESFKGLFLLSLALDSSNPNRTYSFVPLSLIPSARKDELTQLNGKMYDAYLPPVVALKTVFGKPDHPPSATEPIATGDSTIPLCIQGHQLWIVGLKEVPGAVPPPAVDKAANFGIEPNLRKVSDKASFEDRDAFASLDEFLASLKQPSVEILTAGESMYEYYAICRIAPNLCIWAGGDKVGQSNYGFYSKATDSNKQELKGSQKWIRLVDVPTDNGQAPNVQGTVFFVPNHYSGPVTVETQYSDDKGNKASSISRTVTWNK